MSATLIPSFLDGGSETLIVFNLEEVSTPKVSTLIVSIGFFLAIIKFGSFTNLGSLSLRSAVRTAGSLVTIDSVPPSTSLVINISLPFYKSTAGQKTTTYQESAYIEI